jgi:flagellar assembly factor FliW
MTAHAQLTRLETTRFGAIEVPEDAIIRFPRGLYGLEEARAYCLLSHDERGCFQWLQAADAPALAMLVTDPFLFFSNYEIEIPDPAADLLKAASVAQVTIYTPITISADRREIYANLLGPVVINRTAGLGLQVIQDARRYRTRHLIGGRAPAAVHGSRPGSEACERLVDRETAGAPA